MEKDILYIITKHLDKNHSVQLWSDNKETILNLQKIFFQIQAAGDPFIPFNFSPLRKFQELRLFQQGFSIEREKGYWIMLETWNDKEDLMLEFAEHCSEKLNLPFDIM